MCVNLWCVSKEQILKTHNKIILILYLLQWQKTRVDGVRAKRPHAVPGPPQWKEGKTLRADNVFLNCTSFGRAPSRRRCSVSLFRHVFFDSERPHAALRLQLKMSAQDPKCDPRLSVFCNTRVVLQHMPAQYWN